MPTCENCGAHVTSEFARVMGDNYNRVHSCVQCSSNALGSEAGGVDDAEL